ncbi:NADH:flavin oxidoreductase [Streptomyces mutabilis]|uniref:N-methylproline demethylase n=1 Tax=Streptomyces mutabilis TaxID=67332 RepID=A0A086MQP4_9ACTN|nr:NADH:flavin oxidoreductase [Streptomyces mutabilis]KFG71212.1 N-methylproline demethylase [Streptomyces mutabilis]
MPTNDPLLEPFDMGHLRLKNRVVSTSHEPAYAQDGMPKERYLRYHLEKAKGGLALTMMGGAACVAPESPAFVNNIALFRDEVVPYFRAIADAVHEHDTLVMCQVTHAGRRTSNYAGDWLPVISASGDREPQHRAFPKVAEDWDMERVITAYADAAERCKAGGLDGIELMGNGHLLDQFWSPATNHRDDEWGGDFERRLRFPLEVVRAVKERVGEDFVVGLRMAVDEARPGGLTAEGGLEVARRMTAEGIDFLSVLRGSLDTDRNLARVIAPMGTPAAPDLDFAAEVKRDLGIPVMHAGRIADLPTARHAVREGLLDMVGMTRAHIADPHLMRRLAEGQEDRIRPCVGAGYCIDRIYEGGDALCLHNPATGRETVLPHEIPVAPRPKSAVVVGAGPAGLEAARVLAERGHQVTVLEAGSKPGGQIAIAAAAPRRRDLIGIVDWRVEECQRLGVKIRCNTYADASDVLEHQPDVVIVATGGIPNTEIVDGPPNLITDSWQILTREVKLAKSVVVYDDNGDHAAMSVAEVIAESGAELEVVTPERVVAPLVGGTNYPAYLKAFARHSVRLTLNSRVASVRQEADRRLTVTLTNEYGETTETRTVDQLVVEHGTTPVDDVYAELKKHSRNHGAVDQDALLGLRPQQIVHNEDSRFQLFRVGDAVSSRNIHAAILDAYRLCLVI